MNKKTITSTVLTALFCALIASGAFIRIPIPPVPVTLQTLFVLIAALLLPLKISLTSVLVYLFLGTIGLPIFTTGGGLAAISGPTAGYLIGLIPCTIVSGLMIKVKKDSIPWALLSSFVGTVFIYICGLFWLSYSRKLGFAATLTSGLVPFLIGDTIKIIVSAIVSVKLRGQVDKLLDEDND